MSTVITNNVVNSSGATAKTAVNPTKFNYTADWRETKRQATEVTLTSLTSPVSAPWTMRFARSRIANVYKDTGIDPTRYAANRRGISVLAQVNGIVTATDATIRSVSDMPVSAHLVLRVPEGWPADAVGPGENPSAVTAADMAVEMVLNLLGALYEESDATMQNRLSALIRGALLPAALT